ncbi:MAG: hypothetical protein HY236_08320 [Acidobacteria bacterium]|nr:hypothetical protein [Acidobacteriota bacterium]
MTRRMIPLLALAVAFVWTARAADWEGVLMDKMCSMKAMQEGGQKAATMHKRDCALMPDCVKSGYGVVTADNKFLALDAEGNKKAEHALRASKKADDIRVKVTGSESGDTIHVKTLKIL